MKIRHYHSFAPERKKGRWKRWLTLILLIICISSMVYTVNLDGYQIKSVSVTGAVLTDEAKVRQIAEQSIKGRYFFVVPKTFIWSYPKSEIKRQIEGLLSVSDADISADSETGTLGISIKELAQKYLWCASENDKCYYMDENGLVFNEAPLLEGSVFFVFSGLIEGEPLGQLFLPEEQMAGLVKFMDGVRSIGFVSRAVNAVSMSEIHVILQSGTDLIISMDKPFDEALENLKILKDSGDFTSASGGVDKTKYIDLRYGAKAFWK